MTNLFKKIILINHLIIIGGAILGLTVAPELGWLMFVPVALFWLGIVYITTLVYVLKIFIVAMSTEDSDKTIKKSNLDDFFILTSLFIIVPPILYLFGVIEL